MRITPVALLMALSLTLPSMACEDSRPPCGDGPSLKTVKLPVIYHVSKSDSYLGAVTISKAGEASFEAAEGAPADKLKDFRETFDKAASGDSVSLKFETRRGSTRHMCGASIKKGTEKYPAAFKWHLYDKYYELSVTVPSQAGKKKPSVVKPDKKGEKDGDPCDNPPKFEVLELPAEFHAYRSNEYMGKVTIPKEGEPTFTADKKADKDKLESFELLFESALEGEKLTIKYGASRGTERFTCGIEVKKGTPKFPAALKDHLGRGYNRLTDEPPAQP